MDSVDTINHWGVGLSGGKIVLETAGSFAAGGQPDDLIIDNGGVYTHANPSITNHQPVIKGTGTFNLTLTGAQAPTITAVTFLYGTGPDSSMAGCLVGSENCSPGIPTTHITVPEPASWALMLLGFGGLGAALRRQRHRRAFTAA